VPVQPAGQTEAEDALPLMLDFASEVAFGCQSELVVQNSVKTRKGLNKCDGNFRLSERHYPLRTLVARRAFSVAFSLPVLI